MLFVQHTDSVEVVFNKIKKSDDVFFHELSTDWPRYEIREFHRAQTKIAFDLDNTELVLVSFGLKWKNVVRSVTTNTNIDFVSLSLTSINSGF